MCCEAQVTMMGDSRSDSQTVDICQTPLSEIRWVNSSGSDSGLQLTHSSERMFLWAGSKPPDGRNDRKSLYQKIREYEVLDKKKTVTALKAGEDRAILLGLSMVFISVMMYFVLGITILRSYSDSVWTEEASCTIVNSTIVWDVNCSYSCGTECWKHSRYPCLQVYVSLNSSGKVVRLLHNEETHEDNPECFYIPKCRKDYAATHAIVLNISERLRSQHTIQCFVDPTRRADSAILTQIYGPGVVFHSLFWPTCTLIGGTIIIAMVKLTQYLSILCESLSRIKRKQWTRIQSFPRCAPTLCLNLLGSNGFLYHQLSTHPFNPFSSLDQFLQLRVNIEYCNKERTKEKAFDNKKQKKNKTKKQQLWLQLYRLYLRTDLSYM
ncbi:calcium-activated potassium channel subunit beta-2 isoform X2 [Mugil cephalus]|uniref:calcium-activated potassium channel subunit beta-2 isoform X2 n=2 Tax=Mugil cephalus TaxID=48193 RepID=UPI001FB7F713|nr:calcium-activated potassium channel subunit beta-2 isoform X2 [Mugil cephalus]